MCLPKSAGGLHITNLKTWNRAAITKVCWELEHKQDRLWVRWIHSYYIKGQSSATIPIPQQASWMVRKVIEARGNLNQAQAFAAGNNNMRHIYINMLGVYPKMTWKHLICSNDARPKAIFTLRVQLHGHLNTAERLISWGMMVDSICTLCQTHHETKEHLFVDCVFGKSLWARLMQWLKWVTRPAHSWPQRPHWILKQTGEISSRSGPENDIYRMDTCRLD
ncbi:uncharacterized protein LOC132047528 [Lycium ferocissimum]|uniref:uncharacterized protein LOC132047528 n=1 Tax=Lycium ferocissimum TaxID=112874 RepID=UPI002814FD57|nr:uncharacterized protein LOC132047528 [Lycium ferocissimum]